MSTILENLELTMSTIAVVVEPPKEAPRFDEAYLLRFLHSPFGIGQLADGQTVITSNRDQIEIWLSPTRIEIRDLSGKTEFDNSRLPELLKSFFTEYATTLRSYGVNLIVSLKKERPAEWISVHMLHPKLGHTLEKSVIGSNSVSVTLQAEPKTWNIQFSVQQGRLQINLNASEGTNELPSEDDLRTQLDEQYASLENLISQLGS